MCLLFFLWQRWYWYWDTYQSISGMTLAFFKEDLTKVLLHHNESSFYVLSILDHLFWGFKHTTQALWAKLPRTPHGHWLKPSSIIHVTLTLFLLIFPTKCPHFSYQYSPTVNWCLGFVIRLLVWLTKLWHSWICQATWHLFFFIEYQQACNTLQ